MNKIEKLIEELCPQGVEFRALEEVAEVLNGYAFKSKNYCHNGIRIIRISDVQKGKMSDKDLIFYPLASENEIKRYILKENDLVMSLTGNVGRVAMLSKNDLPAGLNQRVACIRVKTSALTRYLFHFFDQISFETEAMSNATGGGQKNMSTTWLKKFQIPIPPLAIQKEIVKILDNFTRLEAELEAELEERTTQYSYYSTMLFDNAKKYGVSSIKEICFMKKGATPIQKAIPGKYPMVVTTTVRRSCATYQFNAKAVCIPLVSSRGHGVASLNHVYYQEGKFALGNILCAITPKNEDQVDAKYLYYYFEQTKDYTIVPLMKGGANVALRMNDIEKVKVPIPPIEEQNRIVAILDKFDALVNDISAGLPAEIEARRKQYEYYRNQLLTFKPLELQDAN